MARKSGPSRQNDGERGEHDDLEEEQDAARAKRELRGERAAEERVQMTARDEDRADARAGAEDPVDREEDAAHRALADRGPEREERGVAGAAESADPRRG